MAGVLDIAVAGCGPAGLATALLLESAGHRVTLVERFDEPRPLGSGLIIQPTGLAVLRELGLAHEIVARGSRIDRLFGLNAERGSVVLDVRYAALRDGSFGIGLHRAALFDALFGAVAARAIPVETGIEIVGVERPGGRIHLVTAEGRNLGPFDLVVDASGARSPLLGEAARPVTRRALPYGALWTNLPLGDHGFDPHALEQRYRRASVMLGVLPIGSHGGEVPLASFFWSLKPDRYEAWRGAGLDSWKREVLAHWPQLEPLLAAIRDPDQLVLASYRHQTLPLPYGERIAFVGDSAHATSPQLGQGANMALLDAYALALVLRQDRPLAQALADYASLRRWHVRLYQGASRVFTPFYQSDSRMLPMIRDRLVPSLARLPGIDRMLALLVAGRVGAPLSRLGLAAKGDLDAAVPKGHPKR